MIITALQPESIIRPRDLYQLFARGQPRDLLDVRTGPEYTTAHVAGAKRVSLDKLDAAAFLKERGACDKPLYVICQGGTRARHAIEKFRRAGYEGCVLVEGGIQAWMDAGLPVNCGTGRVLPLMQQVQVTVGLLAVIGAMLALAVNAWFALIPLALGCGLLFAGLTGFCGLALVLAKMPWNRSIGDKACCTT
jgi:rhodanese-related sulfurtransferase